MRRAEALVADGSISARERDQTLATLLASEAAVRQAEAGRAIGTQDVRTVVVGRSGLEAAVAAAKAQLRLAQIDLDNTVIRAPVDGQLSEIGVRNGAYVTPGTQLLFLVPHDVWVIANFKEAQTRNMRIGQPVTFRADALGRAKFLRARSGSLARRGLGVRGDQGGQRDRQLREGGTAYRRTDLDRSRPGAGAAAAPGDVGGGVDRHARSANE